MYLKRPIQSFATMRVKWYDKLSVLISFYCCRLQLIVQLIIEKCLSPGEKLQINLSSCDWLPSTVTVYVLVTAQAGKQSQSARQPPKGKSNWLWQRLKYNTVSCETIFIHKARAWAFIQMTFIVKQIDKSRNLNKSLLLCLHFYSTANAKC